MNSFYESLNHYQFYLRIYCSFIVRRIAFASIKIKTLLTMNNRKFELYYLFNYNFEMCVHIVFNQMKSNGMLILLLKDIKSMCLANYVM